MSTIIPKTKAKGTDICGGVEFCYIIRSDLGCYMQSRDLNKGSDISIHSLHPACKDGDHYLCGEGGSFYIIKGNDYRRVKSLTTDSEAQVYSLHPNCQGGTHYFITSEYFYIVFQDKGTYRKTKDMTTYSSGEEHNLHPEYKNGLYYWGRFYLFFCYIKPVSKWGVEYCISLDFNTDKMSSVGSIHPDVLNFLPGGLSVTKGPAFGVWENIKTITNDSNTPGTWTKKIVKKVGYNKEKMTQITHNWNIAASVSAESGELAALIAKVQFSFTAEYGGSHVSTENESWNEATEVEEQLSFELKPNQRLYLWQYKLGLGKESVLFCRDLKIDDDPNPPTEVPLPPAQS